jgi:hypothetical protein
MVLTVSFALSPAIGLSCHRHQRKTFRKLDASVEASGPHDFAVRVSAFRQARRHVHRIPLPPSVTIAIRPSFGNGTARVVEVFLANGEAEYFCEGGWTGESRNSPSSKSVDLLPLSSLYLVTYVVVVYLSMRAQVRTPRGRTTSTTSWPGSSRPSTSLSAKKN